MKRWQFLAKFAMVLAVATLLCSCSSTAVVSRVADRITTPNGGKVYVVATEKTSFYRYGPQQGNGPDSELPKDTLVNLIRNSFGYSKVQLAANGQQGFVASEDIMPASATLLASLSKPQPTLTGSATSPASNREDFNVRSTGSSFVPPPEALPDPDLPPSGAEPTP
jgi:hypothetical protein